MPRPKKHGRHFARGVVGSCLTWLDVDAALPRCADGTTICGVVGLKKAAPDGYLSCVIHVKRSTTPSSCVALKSAVDHSHATVSYCRQDAIPGCVCHVVSEGAGPHHNATIVRPNTRCHVVVADAALVQQHTCLIAQNSQEVAWTRGKIALTHCHSAAYNAQNHDNITFGVHCNRGDFGLDKDCVTLTADGQQTTWEVALVALRPSHTLLGQIGPPQPFEHLVCPGCDSAASARQLGSYQATLIAGAVQ